MKGKKILAVALAATMVLGSSITVFAVFGIINHIESEDCAQLGCRKCTVDVEKTTNGLVHQCQRKGIGTIGSIADYHIFPIVLGAAYE